MSGPRIMSVGWGGAWDPEAGRWRGSFLPVPKGSSEPAWEHGGGTEIGALRTVGVKAVRWRGRTRRVPLLWECHRRIGEALRWHHMSTTGVLRGFTTRDLCSLDSWWQLGRKAQELLQRYPEADRLRLILRHRNGAFPISITATCGRSIWPEDRPVVLEPVIWPFVRRPQGAMQRMQSIAKTTFREDYDRALDQARAVGADDALIVDPGGVVAETVIGNILVPQRIGSHSGGCCWLDMSSPRRQFGLGEGLLTSVWQPFEPGLSADRLQDLLHPRPLAVVNSVRGPRQAVLREWPHVPAADLEHARELWEAAVSLTVGRFLAQIA